MKPFWLCLWFCLCLMAGPATAAIDVHDDHGNMVSLPQPARRVISLAPHVTELLFAAGGGDRLVGAVTYSDYPDAAKRIPRVGDNRQVDLERIIAMKPDLVVIWRHGGSERQLAQLRQLGIPLFYSEPHKLDDIPDSVLRLGLLMGTSQQAQRVADELRATLSSLATSYGHRPTVRLFYQVWDKPLYTLNGRHIIGDALHLCGGENVFADLPATAPTVSIEAVLQADPEAIIGTAERHPADGGVAMWKRYPMMRAVKGDNLITLDGNLLNRPGPRLIAGTAILCKKLEQVRQHRKAMP